MAELLLRLRDRELSRVPILSARTTLGRDATSDLVIDNAGVSRVHALVTFKDEVYYVQDAESQNGIMVNGKPVKHVALDYGDVIGIGKFEIELVQSQHYPAAPAYDTSGNLPKRNVLRTMQMDAGAAARIRDEAMARLAAQKGLAQPPGRTTAAPSRPTVPADSSDALAVLKIVGMVLAAIVVIGGGVLYLLLASRADDHGRHGVCAGTRLREIRKRKRRALRL